MVLAFDGSDNLTDRYLWGPAVDQVLADEYFPSRPAVAQRGPRHDALDAGRQSGLGDGCRQRQLPALRAHRLQSVRRRNVSIKTTPPAGYVLPVGFTGTYTDPVTGYQLHGGAGTILSVSAGSARTRMGSRRTNPYEYCGNGPTNGTDPSGMSEWRAGPPRTWWDNVYDFFCAVWRQYHLIMASIQRRATDHEPGRTLNPTPETNGSSRLH